MNGVRLAYQSSFSFSLFVQSPYNLPILLSTTSYQRQYADREVWVGDFLVVFFSLILKSFSRSTSVYVFLNINWLHALSFYASNKQKTQL